MLLGCKKVEEVALNDLDLFGFRNCVDEGIINHNQVA